MYMAIINPTMIHKLKDVIQNELMAYTHDGMELPVENWNEAVHSFDDLAGVINNSTKGYDRTFSF